MMLVALKKLRYPRGRHGLEYQPGDSFRALTDRDAAALKLVGAAKDHPEKPIAKKAMSARPAKVPAPAEVAPPAASENSYTDANTTVRSYGRRDMRAED